MADRDVSGVALASAVAGGVLLWSGITGRKTTLVLRDIVTGKDPSKEPVFYKISVPQGGSSDTSATGVSTATGDAAGVINTALAEVGYHEGPGNENKYGSALGRPPEAWCGDFVDWVLKQNGVNFVSCRSAPGGYRASHATPGSTGIRAGDVCFFDEGTGGVVHVGIAVSDEQNGMWSSVEGNYSDQVVHHDRRECAGHARPNYKSG